MIVSRRRFLQIAGISLAALQLERLSPLTALASDTHVYGRVLEPISVGGSVLWPDSVVTILDANDTSYRLPQGWVPRWAIQPMQAHAVEFGGVWPDETFAAEVHAPVAAIHRNASAASLVLGRIGHGGVLMASETLRNAAGQVEWLRVHGPSLNGWVQAAHCHPVALRAEAPAVDRVVLNLERQRLDAFTGSTVALSTPVSTSSEASIDRGEFELRADTPSGDFRTGDVLYSGVPWSLVTATGWQIAGAYWHNRFGAPQPGPHGQLPPLAARWLYQHTSGHAPTFAII